MSTKGQNKRIYNGSDAYMVEQAAISKILLTTHLSDFKKFDATLNENFIAIFDAAILAAFTVVKDSTAILPQIEQTQKVQELMKKGQNIYQDIMYFVSRKAFKKNKLVANEFGQAEYKKAKTNQANFALFLKTFYTTATKYKANLVEMGCSESLIDSIELVAISLREENTSQEVLKRNRSSLTFDRITVLNACYEKLALVYEAAQQIYRADLLKKALFVFKPSTKINSGTIFRNEIADNTTDMVFNLPYKEERVLSIRTAGTDLWFGLSNDKQTFIGIPILVPKNEFFIQKMSKFGTEGRFFIVKNETKIASRYVLETDR